MSLTVLVHRAEEGGFWAEIPELPGCMSQGETLDELQANIVEAAEAWLMAHFEDEGEPFPETLAKWEIPVPALPRGGRATTAVSA